MREEKTNIIKKFAKNSKDVGSVQVQIGLLSSKINTLSEHFKQHKKDKHSSRGLMFNVNKRKRLLSYLKKKDPTSYSEIIKSLNLRK
jgi:small subunit ribosomal protein S15